MARGRNPNVAVAGCWLLAMLTWIHGHETPFWHAYLVPAEDLSLTKRMYCPNKWHCSYISLWRLMEHKQKNKKWDLNEVTNIDTWP